VRSKLSSVVLIESPLQLINYLKLRNKYECDRVILRCNTSGNTHIQLKNLCERYSVKFKSCCFEEKGSFQYFYSFLRVALILFFERIFSKNIFICGDARSVVFKASRFFFWEKIILVDDGMYLYPYAKEYPFKLKGLSIYTSLPIEESSLYEVIESEPANIIGGVESADVFFIGSKVVDAGIITLDCFLNLMASVFHYFAPLNDGVFYYIAHRDESGKVLSEVCKIGFTVKTYTLPIEVEMIGADITPKAFVSFYSTALYNLSTTLNAEYFSVVIPSCDINKNVDAVIEIYELFKKLKSIEVKEF